MSRRPLFWRIKQGCFPGKPGKCIGMYMREKYESLSLVVLKDIAKTRGMKHISSMKKQELVDAMLKRDEEEENKKENMAHPEVSAEKEALDSGITANGILEVLPDGYGFIRCANYLPGENDVYVAPSQIRRFNLKTGDIVVGNTRVKTQTEKFSALLYIKSKIGRAHV